MNVFDFCAKSCCQIALVYYSYWKWNYVLNRLIHRYIYKYIYNHHYLLIYFWCLFQKVLHRVHCAIWFKFINLLWFLCFYSLSDGYGWKNSGQDCFCGKILYDWNKVNVNLILFIVVLKVIKVFRIKIISVWYLFQSWK